jgi:hypothetical protein
MASIRARLDRIKDDPTELIDPEAVERACREAGHRWRDRTLDPLGTLRAFAVQIAHGNTAMAHVVRLMGAAGMEFSESAYCQARSRLPVAAVRAAFEGFTTRVRNTWGRGASDGLWHGHRTGLMDGSGVSTPDTPELRTTFGVRSNCAEGAGLPLIQTLMLFDAYEGLLLDLHAAPAYTHDQRHAHDLHPALRPGDVLVGDRGFASYVHLHRLAAIGCHGVFRVSSSWKIPFPARGGERTRNGYNRHRRHEPLLVELINKDDQVIEIVKPHNRPDHVTPEEFAKVPGKMVVRAVRYRVVGKGLRTREVTLVTTLIDAEKYPAKDLADLYLTRWRIEVNLRHLKRTMGMDRLKCQSVDGVMRELLMFALVYNAVCHVRVRAARAQGVEPVRISFVDTLRTMLPSVHTLATRIADPPKLKVWPTREPRTHPRLLKHKHSDFRVLRQSRTKAVKWLTQHQAAN